SWSGRRGQVASTGLSSGRALCPGGRRPSSAFERRSSRGRGRESTRVDMLKGSIWLLLLPLWGQVPPPGPAPEASGRLAAERRAVLARESAKLSALADRLAREGRVEEGARIRATIEPTLPRNGPTRFVPLPERVLAPGAGLANLPTDPADVEGR